MTDYEIAKEITVALLHQIAPVKPDALIDKTQDLGKAAGSIYKDKEVHKAVKESMGIR